MFKPLLAVLKNQDIDSFLAGLKDDINPGNFAIVKFAIVKNDIKATLDFLEWLFSVDGLNKDVQYHVLNFFLQARWDLIKGTQCDYTSMPHHPINVICTAIASALNEIDVARAPKQEKDELLAQQKIIQLPSIEQRLMYTLDSSSNQDSVRDITQEIHDHGNGALARSDDKSVLTEAALAQQTESFNFVGRILECTKLATTNQAMLLREIIEKGSVAWLQLYHQCGLDILLQWTVDNNRRICALEAALSATPIKEQMARKLIELGADLGPKMSSYRTEKQIELGLLCALVLNGSKNDLLMTNNLHSTAISASKPVARRAEMIAFAVKRCNERGILKDDVRKFLMRKWSDRDDVLTEIQMQIIPHEPAVFDELFELREFRAVLFEETHQSRQAKILKEIIETASLVGLRSYKKAGFDLNAKWYDTALGRDISALEAVLSATPINQDMAIELITQGADLKTDINSHKPPLSLLTPVLLKCPGSSLMNKLLEKMDELAGSNPDAFINILNKGDFRSFPNTVMFNSRVEHLGFLEKHDQHIENPIALLSAAINTAKSVKRLVEMVAFAVGLCNKRNISSEDVRKFLMHKWPEDSQNILTLIQMEIIPHEPAVFDKLLELNHFKDVLLKNTPPSKQAEILEKITRAGSAEGRESYLKAEFDIHSIDAVRAVLMAAFSTQAIQQGERTVNQKLLDNIDSAVKCWNEKSRSPEDLQSLLSDKQPQHLQNLFTKIKDDILVKEPEMFRKLLKLKSLKSVLAQKWRSHIVREVYSSYSSSIRSRYCEVLFELGITETLQFDEIAQLVNVLNKSQWKPEQSDEQMKTLFQQHPLAISLCCGFRQKLNLQDVINEALHQTDGFTWKYIQKNFNEFCNQLGIGLKSQDALRLYAAAVVSRLPQDSEKRQRLVRLIKGSSLCTIQDLTDALKQHRNTFFWHIDSAASWGAMPKDLKDWVADQENRFILPIKKISSTDPRDEWRHALYNRL